MGVHAAPVFGSPASGKNSPAPSSFSGYGSGSGRCACRSSSVYTSRSLGLTRKICSAGTPAHVDVLRPCRRHPGSVLFDDLFAGQVVAAGAHARDGAVPGAADGEFAALGIHRREALPDRRIALPAGVVRQRLSGLLALLDQVLARRFGDGRGVRSVVRVLIARGSTPASASSRLTLCTSRSTAEPRSTLSSARYSRFAGAWK